MTRRAAARAEGLIGRSIVAHHPRVQTELARPQGITTELEGHHDDEHAVLKVRLVPEGQRRSSPDLPQTQGHCLPV